jgi:uncharacterized membrane protein
VQAPSSVMDLRAPRAASLLVAIRTFALLFGEGASLGLALWGLLVDEGVLPYALYNRLPSYDRQVLLAAMFGTGAAACVVAGAFMAFRIRDSLARLEQIALRLSPVLFVGFLPFLFRWQLWTDREATYGVLVTVLGLALRWSFLSALQANPLFPKSGAAAALAFTVDRLAGLSWAPPLLVGLGTLGYAAFFSYHTIAAHHNLLTYSYDLGLEDNLLYNVVHFGPFLKSSPPFGPTGSHFGFHATFFAYVIAPFYALYQRAETLLVVQSVMIAIAAVPLYLFAKRYLDAWSACVLALCYLLYAPVHGSNLYDFHYLPLGVVFMWFTLYAADARRYKLAAVMLVLGLSVREDVAADMVIVGLVLIAIGRSLPGVIVAGVSGAYFLLMKMVLMPMALAGDSSFIHQWQGLLPAGERGYGGVLKTVIANPVFTLNSLLEKEKFLYLVQLGAPLCFFPWRRPLGLLCSLPGFFFTLLATGYLPLIQISFQYTAHWTSFLLVAVVMNLHWVGKPQYPADRLGIWRQRSWLLAILFSTLVTSFQWGAVFQQNTVKGGFGPYKFGSSSDERERYQKLLKIIAKVPPKAKIVSSENIVPHVSNRPDAYTLRQGIYDADWLLYTMPLNVFPEELANVRSALKGSFGVVVDDPPFVLAKRGHPTSLNEKVLHRLR